MEYLKVVGGCATASGLVISAALFAIRSLIRQNNDRLMERFNGRYLRRDLYEQRTTDLESKLDLIHSFQKERRTVDTDRFEEVSDLCQAVKASQEAQNVRLAVIESRVQTVLHKRNQ